MNEKISKNVRVSKGVCRVCGTERKAYYLSNYSYGERLMMTLDSRYYGYINLINDKVYDEVELIMKELLDSENIKLTLQNNAECLNSVFGIACDKLENVSIDASNNTKYCLNCGSNDIDFKSDNLACIEEVSFTIITHEKWNSISSNEKVLLIKRELINGNYL